LQDEVIERARSNPKSSRRKSSSKSKSSPKQAEDAAELKRLQRNKDKREAKLLEEAEKTRRAQFAVDEAVAYSAEQDASSEEIISSSGSESESEFESHLPASSLTPRRESIRQRAQSPSSDRPYSVHEVDDSAVPSCCNTGLALRFAVLVALLFTALAVTLGTFLGEEAFATQGGLPAPAGSGPLVCATHALATLNEHTQPTNIVFMAGVGAALGGLYGGLVADV